MKHLPYHKQQTPFTCSLACLKMVLESIGREMTEVELVKITGFNPKIGFSPKMMDSLCEIINVDYEHYFDSNLEEMEKYIEEGFYPIVLVNAGILYNLHKEKHGHFIIVKDITKENVIINDPDQEYGKENKKISREKFLNAWKNRYNLIFVIKGEKK